MIRMPKGKADTRGVLISGLVLFIFGILVFIPSVLSYRYFSDEDKAMKEKAERMGIGEVPGVSLDDTVTFFLSSAIVGGLLSAAGGALMLAAILINRGTRESGPGAGRSP